MFEMPGHREGFIKRVTCHACGAQKATRSATAFVYCDCCAALTDWDFQIAISDPSSRLPGPAYEALLKELGDPLAAALAQKDRDAYLALQRRVFASYVEACPAACPPRCRDPEYRARFVEYSAEGATIGAFEPDSSGRAAALDAAVKAIEWTMEGGAVKAEPRSFWRMFDAFAATMEDPPEGRAHPAFALAHPDGAPVSLLRKMAMSMFVQGWIPYLTEEMTRALLERTGLASEYVQAPDVKAHDAACGHCGGAMKLVDGATRALCDGCGHVVGAGRAVVPCVSCGAALAMPEGANAFACPFCRAELRAMRW